MLQPLVDKFRANIPQSVLSIVLLLGISGCTKANPLYCSEASDCASNLCNVETNECEPIASADASHLDGSHDGGMELLDAPGPDAWVCTGNASCVSPTAPFCNMETGTCRACADPGEETSECMALGAAGPVCTSAGSCEECEAAVGCVSETNRPICGSDHTCRGCEAKNECTFANATQCGDDGTCVECLDHGDCASEVCNIQSRTCVTDGDILYVDRNTGSNDAQCGTSAAPCASIQTAVSRLQNQLYIRVHQGDFTENLDFNGVVVTVVAPEAGLVSVSLNTPGITVRGSSDVTFDGLTVRNVTGTADAYGFSCSGTGTRLELSRVIVTANSSGLAGLYSFACNVAVTDSRIEDSQVGAHIQSGQFELRRSTLSRNRGGGLLIQNASYEVVNNFIVDNGLDGGSGSDFGGIRIDNFGNTGTQVLANNTIANNSALAAAGARGVSCEVGGSATTLLSSNIVWGGLGGLQLLDGNCAWRYSNVEGGVDGTANIELDPEFLDELGNYHIKSSSPCRNQGESLTQVPDDFDQQLRDLDPDIGADEF